MKYIWESKDIVPGLFVCKHPSYQGHDEFEPCGNTLKWIRQVGYHGISKNRDGGKYVTIAIIDGMIFNQKTKEELAAQFNEEEMVPMPFDWMQKAMEMKMKGYYRA